MDSFYLVIFPFQSIVHKRRNPHLNANVVVVPVTKHLLITKIKVHLLSILMLFCCFFL